MKYTYRRVMYCKRGGYVEYMYIWYDKLVLTKTYRDELVFGNKNKQFVEGYNAQIVKVRDVIKPKGVK